MIIDNYNHLPPEKFITDMKLHMEKEYCCETMKKYLNGWNSYIFDAKDWPGDGTAIFIKP